MEPYFVNLDGSGSSSVQGCLKGVTFMSDAGDQAKCHRLTGVPYGIPPVGDLRWTRPLPLPRGYSYGSKDQPLDCAEFPPASAQSRCPEFLARLVSGDGQNGFSEACLNLNMWIPGGKPPADGWPVYFYLHGGFLQFGDANLGPTRDPSDLLFDTDVRCIIIMPMYRLGIFGFLASSELQQEAQVAGLKCGNYGLWDQRLALEWTHANVVAFGGNPQNITVGGYSGGSYSAFLQLQYDLMRPAEGQIIRRIVMQSNGPGVLPVSLGSAQKQFDRVLELCGIDNKPSPGDKLKVLRNMDHSAILSKLSSQKDMDLVFRPILDEDFVQLSLCQIHNNSLASLAVKRGIKFFMGSTQHEENFYGSERVISYEEMISRLCRNFPLLAVKAVVPHYNISDVYSNTDDWKKLHGRILADLQVYIPTRGLVSSLQEAGVPLSSLFRYEIKWRVDGTVSILPDSLGVTHGTDMFFIWFYNKKAGLSRTEQAVIKTWLKPFAAFIRGDEDIGWDAENIKNLRVLDSDGSVQIYRDERWEHAISVWNTLKRVTQSTENSC